MTSIYFQRLNEKTLARRRHVRAVIRSRLGRELTAKDREQISDAYLESYEGHTFCQVRDKNTKARITSSVVHISAEIMESFLKPGKLSSKSTDTSSKKRRHTEALTAAASAKLDINPYTQKPMVQGHGLPTTR